MLNKIIKIVLLSFLLISLNACGGSSYSLSIDEEATDTLSRMPASADSLRMVWLVNESTQMAGYTSDFGSEYLRTRASLFQFVMQEFGKEQSEIQLVRRRKQTESISHDAFESLIRYPAQIQHYEVTSENQLVELALELVKDENTLVFLLSNGIMSYNADSVLNNLLATNDEDILLNNIINIHNLPSSAFRKRVLEDKNLGISLFAFESQFDGMYFNAKFIKRGNSLQKALYNINDPKRPFYLWVFGDATRLGELQAKIENQVKPIHTFNWGLSFDSQSTPQFLNTAKSQSQSYLSGNTVQNLDLTSKASITMAIDLSQLPSSLVDSSFLNSESVRTVHGILPATHGRFEPFVVAALDDVDADLVMGKNFTHRVSLDIGPLQTPDIHEARFELVFTSIQDGSWLDTISIADDRDKNETLGKTFGIHILADELDELFNDRSEMFKIKFKVQSDQNNQP